MKRGRTFGSRRVNTVGNEDERLQSEIVSCDSYVIETASSVMKFKTSKLRRPFLKHPAFLTFSRCYSMATPPNPDQVNPDIDPRPSKRQKFYRKRRNNEARLSDDETKVEEGPDNLDALTVDELISNHGSTHGPDGEQDQHLPLPAAELVFRRKAQRRRLGIEFNNSINDRTTSAPIEESNAVAVQDDAPEVKTLNDRFTAQTGQVADVDKHMYACLLVLVLFDHR